MIIYVMIATFFYLGFFISNKYQNFYYKLSIVMLFIFTAFRNLNLGGTDDVSYRHFFYRSVPYLSKIFSYNHDYSYGYALFNSVIKTIVEDYRVYQVIYSFLAIVLLDIVVKKLQLNKGERNLFLFVYFCYCYMWNNFVLLRQNIAMLIVWIALLGYSDKYFKYYFSIILSWLWHKSSIVNILVFFLLEYIKKIDRRKMLAITSVTSIIFLIISETIFNYLANIFLMLAGPKFANYVLISEDTRGFNVINYLLRWFFVIIFYVNYEKIKSPHKKTLLNASFIVIMLGSINVGFVGRVVLYYMISIYAMIPIIHQALKREKKFIYLMGIYMAFIIILIRFLLTFSGGELSNYSTFFW